MKKVISAMLIGVLSFSFLAPSAYAVTKVKGYIKKNGTYVAPYHRSTANKSKFDNYSTRGNINPYTGKKGSINPYKTTIKRYR